MTLPELPNSIYRVFSVPPFSISQMLYPMDSRLVLTLVLLFILHSDSANAATLRNETDRLSLLAFKGQITDDPLQVLSSWNNSINLCEWQGITCSLRHQRVTSLNLLGMNLLGSISPHIGNLSFLRLIDLRKNRLHGVIPESIGNLFRLQTLHLGNNTLEGRIPSNLSRCSDLRILDFPRNNLIGNLPPELGSLSKLMVFSASNNNLTGGIPSSFGNLSSLHDFVVQENNLEGSVPETLARIPNLAIFALGVNRLSSNLPFSLYNVSSINTISLTDNQLDGSLPPDIGLTLPNLQLFGIAGNKFSGPIPLSISNASNLRVIDISDNNFSGDVPSTLGSLEGLRWLNIGRNRFGSGKPGELNFLAYLTNCTGLEKLGLYNNDFEGVLPNSFSNLSANLSMLDLSDNRISGSIPLGIGNLVGLNTFLITHNLFNGSIPTSFGELQNLQRLYLDGNKLTGQIPSSLGNMSQLSDLYLQNNSLVGSIPASLGNCSSLQKLDLSRNKFNGSIPEQILQPNNQLIYVDLSHNSLSGSLPAQVGNLINLGHFDVSDNSLSGEIPSALGNCLTLETLYLAHNFFKGAIPATLVSLKGIRELNLSNNNFSGKIPTYLQSLSSLQRLNLSFNDFDGMVPMKGVFQNASAVSLVGNTKLCGGVRTLRLPTCSIKDSGKHRSSLRLILIITIVVLFLVLVLCSLLYLWRRKPKREPSSTPLVGEQHVAVSYKDLLQATNRFSPMNLIGSGSFGHVYKGTLSQCESPVAVKVFNRHQIGASKSFLAECEALRNIRHRNLVKTLTACSSVDYEGNDFKALVFEFMPNGSLERWLHTDANDEQSQTRKLDLLQRLNIALDVASALSYLHHHCHIQIVHCDLKPSNVLLDTDMIPHVGDFGLARLLSETTKNFSISSIGIKGSIGYMAPEYGMGGEASIQGDVYSYGILLLEMFLGRKPTDEMFKDGLNLHNFARTVLTERISEVVDPALADKEVKPEEHIDIMEILSSKVENMQDCEAAIIKIGVACSVESPGERMNMDDVCRQLMSIRDTFLATTERG